MNYYMTIVDLNKQKVVTWKYIRVEKLNEESVEILLKNPEKTKELKITKEGEVIDGSKIYSVEQLNQLIQENSISYDGIFNSGLWLL